MREEALFSNLEETLCVPQIAQGSYFIRYLRRNLHFGAERFILRRSPPFPNIIEKLFPFSDASSFNEKHFCQHRHFEDSSFSSLLKCPFSTWGTKNTHFLMPQVHKILIAQDFRSTAISVRLAVSFYVTPAANRAARKRRIPKLAAQGSNMPALTAASLQSKINNNKLWSLVSYVQTLEEVVQSFFASRKKVFCAMKPIFPIFTAMHDDSR